MFTTNWKAAKTPMVGRLTRNIIETNSIKVPYLYSFLKSLYLLLIDLFRKY